MSHDDLRLEPFPAAWRTVVLRWVDTPEELFRWTAWAGGPPDASVFDRWHSDPDVVPYVLVARGEPRAYGEIWLDVEDGSAELGRLVVAPYHRKQGVGRHLTECLVSAARDRGCRRVWVRVLPTNAPALALYESAGFSQASERLEDKWNRPQRFRFIWLTRCGPEPEGPR